MPYPVWDCNPGSAGAKKKLSIRRAPDGRWANLANREAVAMAHIEAMARAFRGEPWRCLVVEMATRVAYLTSSEHVEDVEAGRLDPVGFPLEDIFEFDPTLFDRLRSQWERERRTDEQLWRSAVPFGSRRAAA